MTYDMLAEILNASWCVDRTKRTKHNIKLLSTAQLGNMRLCLHSISSSVTSNKA